MTTVQKGCWTGPPTGQMQSNRNALPPDYSVLRGCNSDLCNANLMSHDAVPNLSPGVPEDGAGRGAGGAWPQLGTSSLRARIPAPLSR